MHTQHGLIAYISSACVQVCEPCVHIQAQDVHVWYCVNVYMHEYANAWEISARPGACDHMCVHKVSCVCACVQSAVCVYKSAVCVYRVLCV